MGRQIPSKVNKESSIAMTNATYAYRPDYAVPPGRVLAERLDAHGISHAEFARRCGRSAKLISEIIAGKAPVEPKTALEFERVLGVDAGIWLGIEADYRLHLAREEERWRADEAAEWAKGFPISELKRRGFLPDVRLGSETVSGLLSFLGVGSVEAWHRQQERLSVAFRHSPSFASDDKALATWLRMGELEADQKEGGDYNRREFRRALRCIRELTPDRNDAAIERAQELCLESGVVLAIVRPLPKTALSGASRWLTPRKALIQLSARHMRDDQLWFSLFHEAAHLLFHGKRDIFIHNSNADLTESEQKANEWASDFLIPRTDWENFIGESVFTRSTIVSLANTQGIAPGIVVGRLQHERRIPWATALNSLKVPLQWESETV